MFESLFQSFEDVPAARVDPARLVALRALFQQRGLEGFVIPRADEHQNEYTPKCAERLGWLTGFTGSAGVAVVLRDRAAIFVDGRYTLQVRNEVDDKTFTPFDSSQTTPESWISENLRPSWRLGYDPWLHTPGQVGRLEKAAKAAGATLVPVRNSPIDMVWEDRPQPPRGLVALHPPRFTGEDAASKISRVRAGLDKNDALLVSDPHCIAWLLNIRSADLQHTPVTLCFAIVPADGRPSLYIDSRKLPPAVRDRLQQLVAIEPPVRLVDHLEAIGAQRRRVRFDAATAPMLLVQSLERAGGEADTGADPIALMKACKNSVEIAGARAAHLRDGVAVVQFLAWFEPLAKRGKLTEIDAVKALEHFRRNSGKLKDVSFPTISGAGPHAAIVHYRVTQASNRSIGPGLFLLDSGAQYEDGTTDITRTLAIGKPTPEMRDRFTRVLKGHIAIATSVFPKGVSGAQLDSFARRSLWEAGLDYEHGTGHGVGSYLSVHEGPQRIAKLGTTPLEEGMIVSNEPGYYKARHWGIRIENLVLVQSRKVKGAERPLLGFDTLTLAPIDRRLIDLALLSDAELVWLDAYHARVRKLLSPALDKNLKAWLADATRPLRKK